MDTVVLQDESGKKVEYEIVRIVEHDNKQFMVVANGEAHEVLQFEEVEEDIKLFLASEDDADAIFSKLQDISNDAPKPESIEEIE